MPEKIKRAGIFENLGLTDFKRRRTIRALNREEVNSHHEETRLSGLTFPVETRWNEGGAASQMD